MGKITELDKTGSGMLRAVNGDGLDSMVAVGKSPWHYAYNEDMIALEEEGTRITSAEINEAAGLTWNVYQTPAYIYVGEQPEIYNSGFVAQDALMDDQAGFKLVGTQLEEGALPTPDYYLNVRDDIHRVIGVVKKRYRIFQNDTAPVFLDNLVDSSEGTYETAGSLHGGSQVWWLMKLPKDVTVSGDSREKLETYILLMNSHDGSTKIIVSIVTIRVVCQNTLAWALQTALRTTSVKHTESAQSRFAEARRALEIGFKYQEELAIVGDKMTNTSFSDDEFKAFLDSLVPTPEPQVINKKVVNQRGITMAENTKGIITGIYYNNETQTHVKGTLWGAVQAVQYYSDHMSISRNTEGSTAEENRFKRLTSGVNLGAEGFHKALALV